MRRSVTCFILMAITVSACKKESVVEQDPCIDCPVDFRLTDFEPAWSPDGNTIAYVHGDTLPGQTGIWLIDTNGTNKRIFHSSASAYSPDWSPDGNWLVFSDRAQIWKKKLTGDSTMELTHEGRNFYPDWSRSGKQIAYDRTFAYPESDSVQGVWVMDAKSGTNKTQVAIGRMPTWDLLDSALAYVGWLDSMKGGIVRLSLPSKVKQLLWDGKNGADRDPQYSPDGTKILMSFQLLQPSVDHPAVYVIKSDGSEHVKLTAQGWSPAWSSNGEWIAYTDTRRISGRVWLMRKDGSSKHQLTY